MIYLPTPSATVKDIIAKVADRYGYTPEEITGPARPSRLAFARHVAMYIACLCSQRGLTEIGQDFDKGHDIVMYGRNRIRGILEQSGVDAQELAKLIEEIRQECTRKQ